MRRDVATAAQVQHAGSSWADVVGVALQAEKHGRRLAVAPDLVHITGDACAPTGREPLVFSVFDPRRDPDAAASASGPLYVAGRFVVAMRAVAPSR